MADGFELFTDRSVVAMRVNGELKDLAATVTESDVVEPVTIDSPDGLSILRHSTAHVLAQAVQNVNPEAKLGIGPPVTDGFYYDFDVDTPFTPEDLRAIEKVMGRIVKEGQTFRRWDVTEAQAREELKDEPYKLELIGLKGDPAAADGASVEVGLGGLSIYQNVRGAGRESEQVVWQDLCRGPHVPSTGRIPAFRLTSVAGAYWRGDSKNEQLQRIYGTAWASKEDLEASVRVLSRALPEYQAARLAQPRAQA